jgi:hypothetical protein
MSLQSLCFCTLLPFFSFQVLGLGCQNHLTIEVEQPHLFLSNELQSAKIIHCSALFKLLQILVNCNGREREAHAQESFIPLVLRNVALKFLDLNILCPRGKERFDTHPAGLKSFEFLFTLPPHGLEVHLFLFEDSSGLNGFE